MVLLENDSFLTELTKLYNSKKESGTVFITFKRYEHKVVEKEPKEGQHAKNPTKKQIKADLAEGEPKCLIRATDGNNIKISTMVSAKDLVRFQMAYSNIIKVQMDNLKRKEKKKKKAQKKVIV